ncbi:MAG: hypothetical protein Q9187_005894, partial [Circinaria calcarea]
QLNGREFHYAQGKCLGGRGTVGSYQQWADIVGDQGYTFSNISSYFKKSAQFTPPNYAKREADSLITYDPAAFNSTGGPLQVSYLNRYAPISKYFKAAFTSLGLKEIPGLNSGQLFGFSEFTRTIDPQAATRSSSETSFLQEAIASTTLMVYQRTIARKILFSANLSATGVGVDTAGVQYTLFAKKEVILAAGALRSPQILMVSGIGPAAALEKLHIPVLSNLQGVGQNLWDQPYYNAAYRVNVTTQTQLTSNSTFAALAMEEYLTNQTGPYADAGGNVVGWERLPEPFRSQLSPGTVSELSKFPTDWPELELLPTASASTTVNDTFNYASMSIALLSTTSRGNVTINSTDTNRNPLVSPNWLLTTTDQELAVQAFKRARQVANATGIIVGPEYLPGPTVQTDAQILEYLKRTVGTIWHACGAMGQVGDPHAVVDSYGKVFGVSGLRIVDASVFPLLPPGHPQATVYMLAEKLADDIKNGR